MSTMPSAAPTRSEAPSVPGWMQVNLRLVLGVLAVALLLAASTLGRPWLEALGIGSAVLSLLPCAAMCAAGLCMGRGNCSKQGGTAARVPERPAGVGPNGGGA